MNYDKILTIGAISFFAILIILYIIGCLIYYNSSKKEKIYDEVIQKKWFDHKIGELDIDDLYYLKVTLKLIRKKAKEKAKLEEKRYKSYTIDKYDLQKQWREDNMIFKE